MTYTYTKPLAPSTALQKRIHQARQHAANVQAQIELKRIKEGNAERTYWTTLRNTGDNNQARQAAAETRK